LICNMSSESPMNAETIWNAKIRKVVNINEMNVSVKSGANTP